MTKASSTISSILNIFGKHRRPFNSDETQNTVFSPSVISRVSNYVKSNAPIRIVIPAFPDKSTSRGKTLSNNADMAERLSIRYIIRIAHEINAIYKPGVEMVIYSDGGIFDGMCHSSYTKTDRIKYISQLRQIIKEEGGDRFISVRDSENIDLSKYTENEESLKKRIKTHQTTNDQDTHKLYVGQKKFWEEELSQLEPLLSRSQIKKRAGKMASDITRGSAAYSRYIDKKEPEAVRLSCHPKHPLSGKIGIWFNEHKSPATPWHNAAARVHRGSSKQPEETWSMMKAKKARELGLHVVNDSEGNPSHFDISQKQNNAVTTIQRAQREKIRKRKIAEYRHGTSHTYNPQKNISFGR